jgi:sec-independent protein translocase protein TatC
LSFEWLNAYLEHLDDLRKRIIVIAVAVGAIFFFCIVFELKSVVVSGITLPYPYPNPFNPVAIQLFNRMQADLVPAEINGQPVVTAVLNPVDAIMVEIKVAFFIAIAIGMPIIVHQMGKFIAPALKPKEKSLLIKIALPSALLFITGAVFAYMFVVPFVFTFLYRIAGSMVEETFLGPGEFIDFTLTFLVGFGLAFELPVFMVGLCALGLVQPDFWKKNWRYATVAIFVFGAIITPDGSGVTMFMVAIPMLVLYLAGYLISRYKYGVES